MPGNFILGYSIELKNNIEVFEVKLYQCIQEIHKKTKENMLLSLSCHYEKFHFELRIASMLLSP